MEISFQIEREKAVLVIIDVQEALVKAMDSGVVRNLIRNLQTLIAFAKEMGIPMVITEQYPRGLGMTVPEIKQELPSLPPIEKVSFSCGRVDTFNERLDRTGRRSDSSHRDGNPCLRLTDRRTPDPERVRGSCGGRCGLLKEKTRLGNRAPMDGKKRGDDLYHRNHRLSTVEGGRNGGV